MSQQQTDPFARIVFFEGLDKTGKTTLVRRCRFEAVPAHPCLMLDRGFVGRLVFWHFNHEPSFPIESWLGLEACLAEHDHYAIVWLRSGYKAVCERHLLAGEEPPTQSVYLQQEQLYERYMAERKRRGIDIVEVWTDRAAEDVCVGKILKNLGFEWKGGQRAAD